MPEINRPALSRVFVLGVLGLTLANCTSGSMFSFSQSRSSTSAAAVPTPSSLPPAFPAQDLVGRWGLAAYHQEADRERTVEAAANQCGLPYIITPGPNGGVMMHLADEAKSSDLQVKGGPGGKTYIGPPGSPGGMQDREVLSFNGRVLILHWVDPEVQSRYGNMVYVRCPPEGAKPPAHLRHKAKSKRKVKPKS